MNSCFSGYEIYNVVLQAIYQLDRITVDPLLVIKPWFKLVMYDSALVPNDFHKLEPLSRSSDFVISFGCSGGFPTPGVQLDVNLGVCEPMFPSR